MRHLFQQTVGVILLLLVAGSVTSCSFVKGITAWVQPRDQFVATSANPEVRYLPGSQALADRLAAAVSHSVEIVEKTHGVKFAHAPLMFVCHADCFTKFTSASNQVAAAQFGDAVFMNADALQEREQQRGMPPENFLTHELAHLLLYQRAGAVAYKRVPSWFREGIAVLVSNDAGAEACTPANAARKILDGKAFDPTEAGSVLREKTAWNYDLQPPVFYREAELFVRYLRDRNPPAFQTALLEIVGGKDFQSSFSQAYGQSIASYWPEFVTTMNQIAGK